ncbi:hypothetical protein [Streptacidiphilus sp. MAP12-33]|uniref:hypothetical protein n=1 Tax=Streptacidiphilus sp. MAP12-33 TaxID=3156266 RepID=UPI00351282F6
MSFLYEVLEPLPTADAALARARALCSEFGEWTGDPFDPQLGPVVTADQFHYARQHFTYGDFRRADGARIPEDGLHEFWTTIFRGRALRGGDPWRVEVELVPELAEIWPLLVEWGLTLELPYYRSPLYATDADQYCTESDLDTMVRAAGPLGFEVEWDVALRGLPYTKLCGVQLCLNSEWTSQSADPAPGRHAVYLSVGTKNRDVQDAWLASTGLTLGPALLGW